MSSRARIAALVLTAFTAGTVVLLRPLFAAPSVADIETARDQFNAGLDLREKGDLKGALAKLVLADRLVHTPITALELGRTHVMIGHLLEGVEVLLSVARIDKSASESTNAAAARVEAQQLADDTA